MRIYTRPGENGGRVVKGAVHGVVVGLFTTPWGYGTVSVSDGRLVGVELPPLAGAGSTLSGTKVAKRDRVAVARWVEELDAYFRGERLAWKSREVPLDHLVTGAFQKAVYATLLSVSPGKTVSYGELAGMAGYPRAARAVGTAMATNPVPIVVPCHRVIRSDGSLGNYGTDPSWKERLLTHEREHAGVGRRLP